MTEHFQAFISNPPINNDPVIRQLLLELANRNDLVMYSYNVIGRKVNFMSASCQYLLGYEVEDFINGGPDFIFEITDKESIPQIVERQNHYVTLVKEPGYDPATDQIMEFSVVIKHSRGALVPIECFAIILTYTAEADIEHGISLMMDPHASFIEESKSWLRKIKARHNEIYVHKPFTSSNGHLNLVHATNIRYDQRVTPREQEVLALIAKGLSTQELADKLNVSINTVETHRRRLLEKFEAKNVAELIKKASKVFWLE